jgi:hypothetical protein
MFDLQAKDGSVRRRKYNSPIPNDPLPAPIEANQLDAAPMVDMHHRLLDYYTRELDRQAPNRAEQAQEEDFYDNIQWDEEDAAVLEARGQQPLVYNVVSSSIDWLVGTEKRTRTDYHVLPRRQEDGKPAERKSQLLKYLSDVNQSPFNQSRAFEDAAKVGIGWLESGLQDQDDGEPVFDGYENWRNMLWDSAATRLDLEDARYITRAKFVDLDITQAIFPERSGLLERSALANDEFISLDAYGDDVMDSQEQFLNSGGTLPNADTFGYHRRRVRMLESWIKIPVDAWRMRGGAFHTELFDPFSVAHREEIQSGRAEAVKKKTLKVFCAIFTTVGMVWFGPSPYRHNRYPFTPIWGYRRGRDGLPYGMMRRLKDPQVDINKRAAKALWILSSNKVIADEGAVEDVDEAREEVARPDAWIEVKQGKKVELNADRELSQYQYAAMDRSIAMIERAAGVTDENLGRKTNAVSGIAIARRQDQGALATAKLFDHLQLARQVEGEKKLSLIEQFFTEEKQFRITNVRGKPTWLTINDELPENDIIRSKADFVIAEADWQNTMRQAAVEALLETASRFPPQIVLILLDLIVENMDLPNREEIVRRIRAVSGQRDPDAEEPTPEEIQREEQQAADAALQRAGAEAQVRKLLADAKKAEASAEQIVRKMVGDDVAAVNAALTAARETILLPQAAPVADAILAESGFVSQSDRMIAAAREAASNMPQQPAQPAPQPTPGTGVPPAQP